MPTLPTVPFQRRVLLLLMLGGSGGLVARADPPPGGLVPQLFAGSAQPVVFGQSFTVPAGDYPAPRHVNVSLPDGYDLPENRARRYPVLYVLDGGTGYQDFVHIASMVCQGSLWGGANAELIVVGVESLDRRAELTQPSTVAEERRKYPTTGGAERFRHFLVDELKPQVAAAYRTDGTSGLIGESLGGLFVVDDALRHGADFDRYIAISPSLWWNNEGLARSAAELLARQPRAPRRLWLAMANEDAEMRDGMDRLVAALKASPEAGVAWSYAPYPGETHATVYHPAATRAVREVFPAPPPTTAASG